MEKMFEMAIGRHNGKTIQDLQDILKVVGEIGEEFQKYNENLEQEEGGKELINKLYELIDKKDSEIMDLHKQLEESKKDNKTLIEDMDGMIREREHCARMYKEKDKELKKVETELHNDIAYLENELNMANENIEALRYNHGCRVDELNEYEVILNKYKSKNKDLENRKEALKKCCDYYRAECKRYKDAINNHNMTKELIKKDNKINVLMEEKKELLKKIDSLALENVQNDEIIVYNNEVIEDLETIIDLQEEEIEKLEDGLIKNYLSLKLHKSILDAQGISFNEERVDGNKFSVNVNINENANIDEVFESLKRFNKMYGVK